ncbi:hypothetical protein V6N12_042389 [Hibiscus sabdariffa]|uniref:Uncharacterized protein n=1 Tax=Hibiscus sabdariffa TaxID=183260 RepID=A0ABR2EEM5_9ROSI
MLTMKRFEAARLLIGVSQISEIPSTTVVSLKGWGSHGFSVCNKVNGPKKSNKNMSISSKRLNGLRMSHGPTSFENLYDVHVSDVDDSQSTSGNSVSIDPILDAAIGCSESDRS